MSSDIVAIARYEPGLEISLIKKEEIMTAVLAFGFDFEHDCHSPSELTE